jgi:arginine-tRNA-protein transferase
VLRRGAAIRLGWGRPKVEPMRLELYQRWHQDRAAERGWADDQMDAERYFHEFAFPHPAARELTLWHEERLVAVSLVDETEHALSAVYTYHDPDYADWSLGSLSILRQIELAQSANKRWLYLGYRVIGCPSSEYKARFRPHQLLARFVEMNEAPDWISLANRPTSGS